MFEMRFFENLYLKLTRTFTHFR